MTEILQILIEAGEGAFLQVGVFVGAMLLFFGYFNYRYAGGFVRAIGRHTRLQVVLGALLGVSPGCGGAIFVMPLYLRGTVSYGTAVATLVATMGDSSFIIISKMPAQALFIHLISLGVGIAAGYIVDALGVGPKLAVVEETGGGNPVPPQQVRRAHIGHAPGDALSKALHPANREVIGTLGYEITHRGYVFYWLITALGLVLGVILLLQQDISEWIGFDLNRIVGLTGTAISVIWLVSGRHGLADDTHAELEEKTASLKQMFIHNAHETAFVTFWVFVAYALYSLFMHFTQLDLAAIVAQTGILPVLITACVGLIPGCGPQILVVTLYTKGVIPFSALVAHTLSQDGDALFPILAMNPRAALWLTITTTIPAAVVGVLFYAVGY